MVISKNDKKLSKLSRELIEWLSSIVFALIFVVVLFTYVFSIVGVSGGSMEPNFYTGDRVVISGLFYKPKAGDVVVITQPNEKNEPLIKRIVALGGQTVEIDTEEGIVYVDGKALEEPYLNQKTFNDGELSGPVTVPEGYVFVLGDNREISWDSRYHEVGFIDERYLSGKVYLKVWPFEDFKFYFD